jgi:hypothetical protein
MKKCISRGGLWGSKIKWGENFPEREFKMRIHGTLEVLSADIAA